MICTHTYVGMLCSKFDSSVENIGKHFIVVVVNYTMLYYAILLYYIHLFPELRGFCITRGFSGTKMRVMRGLGVVTNLTFQDCRPWDEINQIQILRLGDDGSFRVVLLWLSWSIWNNKISFCWQWDLNSGPSGYQAEALTNLVTNFTGQDCRPWDEINQIQTLCQGDDRSFRVCMYVCYFISQAWECITNAILRKIYNNITNSMPAEKCECHRLRES